MKKNGGPGRKKKSCIQRKCTGNMDHPHSKTTEETKPSSESGETKPSSESGMYMAAGYQYVFNTFVIVHSSNSTKSGRIFSIMAKENGTHRW